ncbi:MAG: sugar transferase [Calditrichaeota bacterium]|nr:sugar transferase [Calditrichota bacterium]
MNTLIIISLLIVDAISASLGFMAIYTVPIEADLSRTSLPVTIFWPMLVLTVFWWIVFLIRGMYKTPVALSRFDEMIKVSKTVFWGVLFIFLITFDTEDFIGFTKIKLLIYGIVIYIFGSLSRTLIRTWQRYLRIKGAGLGNALIVGYTDVGKRLFQQLEDFPVWGFKIKGFVDHEFPEHNASIETEEGINPSGIQQTNARKAKSKILGGIDDLSQIIEEQSIEWVFVAPERQSNDAILAVFDRCVKHRVRMMIVANYYQMVIGLVDTVEIHGLPLVEVITQFAPLHVRIVKRISDLITAFFWVIIVGLTLPFMALAIKLSSPGSVFYKQKRVGREGEEFYLYKFRSMVQDAEKKSGAVWAVKNDPRITKFGRFMRNTHIDEIPQFFNVLKGDMSIVGPRPERKKFVEDFKTKIPLYERRLRIRPGITGWAQVRHKYDETFEDVKDKTRYDLFYMNHMSLALDLRIIILTVKKVFLGERA